MRGLSIVVLSSWLVASAAVPCVNATVSVYVSPEQLSERSPVIVEGRVVEVASGLDPETGTIATYVTLDVRRTHRGRDVPDRIVLREPGGAYGGVVHELDAVPAYVPGEDVFVFLEAAPDGALRTAGMFFGKFVVDRPAEGPSAAIRDLAGQGRILGRGRRPDVEAFSPDELAAVAASVRLRPAPARRGGPGATRPAAPRRWSPAPPEIDRVRWGGRVRAGDAAVSATSGGSTLAPRDPGGSPAAFAPLSSSSPARWNEADSGTAVVVDIERARDPLGDAPAAVGEIERAMSAWTEVPESRITLVTGNGDAQFTASNASPAKSYPPGNIVLFGDPYDDISDPTNCAGVLAIGGYWRFSSPVTTVNGQQFYPARRLYVIFNNGFECFLAQTGNLAEVAMHEIGHGLGFGHSTVPDAIMRAYAYGGGRGPRAGDDDVDAAHCTYPHAFTLTAPAGGESWEVGSTRSVTWTATPEDGGDPGTVDVELSTDGGQTWAPVSEGRTNDGEFSWVVPDAPGTGNRLRVVRHNRVTPTPAPYPEACSAGASAADFTIAAAPAVAGSVPDGAAGAPLTVDRSGDAVTVTWSPSCSSEATDYALYEGSLDALRAGVWDHAAITCAAGADLQETFAPASGARYFLVAPLAGAAEGDLGLQTGGTPRPAATTACAPREPTGC